MVNTTRTIFTGFFALILFGCFFWPAQSDAATLRRAPNNLGLTAYWSFNEGTSTVATDFSRNYATGTLTNFAAPATATSGWGAGKLGKGLSFDGTDDYVQSASFATIPTSVTIAAWIYPTAGGVAVSELGVGGGWHVSQIEVKSTGEIRVGYWTGGATSVSLGTFSLNQWHHVVLTYSSSGTLGSGYVNGVLVNTQVATKQWPGSALQYGIGKSDTTNFGDGTYFNGKIDEVRIYNRALGASEVLALYKSGAATLSAVQRNPVTNGLIGLWSFDGRDVVNGAFLDRSSAGTHPAYMSSTMATSTAYVPGRIGQGIRLDGIDDYMQVPNSADFDFGSNAFTISWWEYRTGNDNGQPSINRTIIAGDYTPFMLGYSYGGSDLLIYMSNNLGAWDVASGEILGPVTLNQWAHYVVKRSGTTFTAYTNGVQTNTWESALAIADAGGTDPEYDLTFGSYQNVYFFKGTLDDIRIYNRAVTATEVTQLYAVGAGAISKINLSKNSVMTSGLVGFWTFDGVDVASAASAIDRSGYVNDGLMYYFTMADAVPGKVGQAWRFTSASSNFVSFYSPFPNITGDDSFTMCAWINPNTVSDPEGIIAHGDTGTVLGAAALFINPTANGAVGLYFDDANEARTAGGVITAGSWYHLCATKTPGAIDTTTNIYVNGQSVALAAASSNTPDIIPSSSSLGSFISAGFYFDGKLDDARVYDRALSATEVLTLYNAEK